VWTVLQVLDILCQRSCVIHVPFIGFIHLPDLSCLNFQLQMLPWENLPVLRNQEIYRMPSIGSILFSLTRNNDRCKDGQVVHPPFPMIDPFNTFYLLNPSGDLSSTQKEFDQLFRNYEWKVNHDIPELAMI
jgi:separase